MRIQLRRFTLAILVMVAVGNVSRGQQQPDIVGFANSWLTWSNQQTNVVYDIQWAPRLSSSWTDTWEHLCGQLVTATVMNAQVPMFYRVAVRTGGIDSLVARYDFKEGSGTTVHDTSGVAPPMDLTICTDQTPPPQADGSHVTWLSGGGLRVDDAAILMATNSDKLLAACTNSGELSIEAWINPTSRDLTGPARIVTQSYGIADRNFSLVAEGGWENSFSMRLRTDIDLEGVNNGSPRLHSIGFLTTGLVHIAFTHDRTQREHFYVNGACVSSGIRQGAGFSNWDPAHIFALGEEIVPSKGTLSATGSLSGVDVDETDVPAGGIADVENGRYGIYAPVDDEESTFIRLFFGSPSEFTVGTHLVEHGFGVSLTWQQEPDWLAHEVAATSGVVVVSTADEEEWVAVYDLRFEDDQHLAGVFDVPVLPTWGDHDGAPRTFYGEYYRVAVYSRALTGAEVGLLSSDSPQ